MQTTNMLIEATAQTITKISNAISPPDNIQSADAQTIRKALQAFGPNNVGENTLHIADILPNVNPETHLLQNAKDILTRPSKNNINQGIQQISKGMALKQGMATPLISLE